MEVLLNFIESILSTIELSQITNGLLNVIVPALAAFAVEYLRRRLGTEKIQRIKEELAAKQDLAALAVRFVEQVYTEIHGKEKYEKAAAWLSARTTECGLKLSAEEVKGLIEAALRGFKDAFGDEWGKQVAGGNNAK